MVSDAACGCTHVRSIAKLGHPVNLELVLNTHVALVCNLHALELIAASM